jgi:hypothetical protein
VDLNRDIVLGGDGGDGGFERGPAVGLVLLRHRPHVDAEDGMIGHDVVGRAALDPRRIDRQARAPGFDKAEREIGCGDDGVAPLLRVAASMGAAAGDRIEKLPLPGRAPASVPSGRAEGS